MTTSLHKINPLVAGTITKKGYWYKHNGIVYEALTDGHVVTEDDIPKRFVEYWRKP